MFDKYLSSLLEVLAIDTTQTAAEVDAPFGKNNAICLDKVLSVAKNMGFSTKNNGGYYGIASVGSPSLTEGTFGILGHLDVVPIGKGWTKNPLGEISDGVLYGRGVLDDKGPMLACLFATADLLASGLSPRRQIQVIFGCNEESGWKCIDKFNECEPAPEMSFSPDGDFPLINCEKGLVQFEVSLPLPKEIAKIEGGTRPNVVMERLEVSLFALTESVLEAAKRHNLSLDTSQDTKLVSIGCAAHASRPSLGENACWKMLAALSDLFGGVWTKLFKTLSDNDGFGLGIKAKDDISGETTMTVGKMQNADRTLKFTIDVRHSLSWSREQVEKQIKATFAKYSVRMLNFHPSLYVSSESELVKNLLASYTAVTGGTPSCLAVGGATYARALPNAVAFGPILPDTLCTIHQKDERVSLADLRTIYSIYKDAIKRLCF